MDAITDKVQEQVYRCMRCGACMEVCPTFSVTGREAHVARGRLNLIQAAFLEGDLEPTGGLAERISECIGCTACEAVCPSGVEVTAIMAAAKETLGSSRSMGRMARSAVRRAIGGSEGKPPHALRLLAGLQQAAYCRAPATRPLPYLRAGVKRSFPPMKRESLMHLLPEVSRPVGTATGRVAFFPGCAINSFYPATGLALVEVLNAGGIEVVTPRGWRCCGLPFRDLGDTDMARSLAEDNLRLFSELDIDAIITACSSCALALKRELPRLMQADRADVKSLSDKVLDVHEYLALLKPDPKTPPGAPVRVTYHDPCHLRWGLGVTSEPRQVIKSLPWVDYNEMPHAGSCCGGGGLFSLYHYDLALKIGGRRADDIAATGAQLVVTACPGCRAHLTDVLSRTGSAARVVHTVELMAGYC